MAKRNSRNGRLFHHKYERLPPSGNPQARDRISSVGFNIKYYLREIEISLRVYEPRCVKYEKGNNVRSKKIQKANVSIIAEVGVNHNGDLELALQSIEEAAEAGADYVKFQFFSADALTTKSAPKARYQEAAGSESSGQQEMLRKLELSKVEQ